MMTPKIRLKGFCGEWKTQQIGDISSSYSGGTPSAGNTSYYGGNIPFIRSGEIHADHTQLFLTEKGYTSSAAKMVSKGDILYALYGATSGEVAISQISGAINQAILAIIVDNGFDNDFVCNQLGRMKSLIVNTYLQGGQGNLSAAIIKSVEFNAPSLPEQRALATFFTSLDNQISAAEKRLASLKQVKAASLQAMFPQEGETTPKLRFKGCEGEWKKEKLGECGTFSKGKGYSKADICAEGTPIILYGSMYTNYSTIIDKVDTYAKINDGAVLSKGGEIIIPASGETPEDIAIASVVKRDGILLGGDLNIITLGEGYDPTFIALGITYSKTHVELSKYAQGKSVVHLHNSEIAQGSIMCPNSLTEQRQIASYFTALDRQITAQSSKISKLKQIKSACLDQMFV